MKKIIPILAVFALTVNAFSQGFLFSSTKAQGVYFTPGYGGAALGNGTITVGFLIGAPSTASAIGAGVSTNAQTPLASTSWSTILNDPNFHFATNGASLVTVAVNNSGLAQGGYSYNGGAAFVPTGTTAGNTYSVFVVAWSSAYANPWLAAAGNSFLGYSSVFQYASSPNSASAAPSFAAAGGTANLPFGVDIVSSVPEPGTMALAALGGASLLLFRRRK
jgi:hypothetical protein